MLKGLGQKLNVVFTLVVMLLCTQHTVWAEEVATTNQNDVVVASKIIQQQQNQAPVVAESDVATSVLPQVANDMAEGESIRALPSLNRPVIDQAKVLNATEIEQLNQKILSLYQQGKAQIGVMIVPTTGQESIFDFALRTAEQWQLGSAKRDNGLLIAIAINDRKIQILTGYGLEGVLPDVVLSRVIRNQITPYFKQGQYAKGVASGLDEISHIVNLDPTIAAQAAQDLKQRHEQALIEKQAKDNTMTTALVILVIGVIASLIVGKRLSAATAGVTTVAAGLLNGAGLVMSLLLGIGVFFLLITSIAQFLLQAFLSSKGRGGGGFGGGGGYSGGGGRFGGGGASGSW